MHSSKCAHRSGRASPTLHVVELANATGVTPAAIRYYSRVGLLSPAREPDNGYRTFSPDDLHRVRFIRKAQGLGLTIADIKEILDLVGVGAMPCERVEEMVNGRLHAIESEIADLRRLESRIKRALAAWQSQPRPHPHADEFCPLIERSLSARRSTRQCTER